MSRNSQHPKIAVAVFSLLLLVTMPALAQHGGYGGGAHGGGGSHGGGHSSGHGGGGHIGGYSSGHSSGFGSHGGYGYGSGNGGHSGEGLSHGFVGSVHAGPRFHPFHPQHFFFHRRRYVAGFGYFPFYSYGLGYGSYGYAPAPVVRPLSGLTLLVFLDNSIVAVADYWADNGELTYVMPDASQYTVPLDQINLAMTEQLNRERGIQFILGPGPNGP